MLKHKRTVLIFSILVVCITVVAIIFKLKDSKPKPAKLACCCKPVHRQKCSKVQELPYIAALESLDVPLFLCSGSIVSPNHIITGAHCVEGKSPEVLQVRVGSSHNLRNGSVHRIRNFIIHPQYEDSNTLYDLAILEIDEPIVLDNYTKRSISIQESDEKSKVGTNALVVGYGCDNDKESIFPNQLRTIYTTILNKRNCWPYFVRQGQICTDGLVSDIETRKVCLKDFGSLLIVDGKLAGVVGTRKYSFNHGHIVFTEVSYYRKWIDEAIKIDDDHTEFPFLVSVEMEGYSVLPCGGAIISPWYIITAASCFDHGNDASKFYVNADLSFEKSNGSRHRVRNITIHPQYQLNEKPLNDLAVLLLEDPIETDYGSKLFIPMVEPDEEIINGSVAKTAGWSCNIKNLTSSVKELRSLNLTIFSKTKSENSPSRGDGLSVAVFSIDSKINCTDYYDNGNPIVIDSKLAGIAPYDGKSDFNESITFVEIAYH